MPLVTQNLKCYLFKNRVERERARESETHIFLLRFFVTLIVLTVVPAAKVSIKIKYLTQFQHLVKM